MVRKNSAKLAEMLEKLAISRDEIVMKILDVDEVKVSLLWRDRSECIFAPLHCVHGTSLKTS